MLTQALGVALFVRGRLGEAAELLDGAIEAARLAGQRPAARLEPPEPRVRRGATRARWRSALAAAEESVELTRDLDESHISMYAGVILAIARMESGNPEQAAELFVAAAGGEELPHVPGGWRAKYLELLTRCWIALGRIDEAERCGRLRVRRRDGRPASARASPGPNGLRQRSRSTRGDHGRGRRARTRVGRRRG